jgi:type II secretory pathway pseudopilin PulG
MRNSTTQSGIGLIEVVVGAAIVGGALIGVMASFNVLVKAGLHNTAKVQSAFYVEEAAEALRYLRDESWTTNLKTLSTSTPHYLAFSGGAWQLSTTPSSFDGFTRTIVLSDVYRDNTTKSITSGGAGSMIDQDARKYEIEITYPGAATSTRVSGYLTNVLNN